MGLKYIAVKTGAKVGAKVAGGVVKGAVKMTGKATGKIVNTINPNLKEDVSNALDKADNMFGDKLDDYFSDEKCQKRAERMQECTEKIKHSKVISFGKEQVSNGIKTGVNVINSRVEEIEEKRKKKEQEEHERLMNTPTSRADRILARTDIIYGTLKGGSRGKRMKERAKETLSRPRL